MKGQTAKRGTLGKKLNLKGSNFKNARGLEVAMVHELLSEMASGEMSLAEMTAECNKVKRLRDLQQSFVDQTGSVSWEEATSKYPAYTTSEALDEFLCMPFSVKNPCPRYCCSVDSLLPARVD